MSVVNKESQAIARKTAWRDVPRNPPAGEQRLSIPALQSWEAMGYGMMITFGMSTFDGEEHSLGDKPASFYSPDQLDVDQWVSVARDAGMKYAVLIAKHTSGFCLWSSDQTKYHVGHSSNKTDVVEAFVRACENRGVKPGLYYCSWDNHAAHLHGSGTPTRVGWVNSFTTEAYREFQRKQVQELLTRYGPIYETWIDIPAVLGHEGRRQQYDQIVSLQPETFINLNHGIADGSRLDANWAWPTDLLSIERLLPTSNRGHNPWLRLKILEAEAVDYYIPAEVVDPIGYEWFHEDGDLPRSDDELLGMYLVTRARGANFLLNVPPNRSGMIPACHVDALNRLRRQIDLRKDL